MTKKKTNNKNLTIGQYVFAKLKGYPFWPAQIIEIPASGYFTVKFFYAEDHAKVGKNYVVEYNEKSKNKILTEKQMKNPSYFKSVEVIELKIKQALNRVNQQRFVTWNEDNAVSGRKKFEKPEPVTLPIIQFESVVENFASTNDELPSEQYHTDIDVVEYDTNTDILEVQEAYFTETQFKSYWYALPEDMQFSYYIQKKMIREIEEIRRNLRIEKFNMRKALKLLKEFQLYNMPGISPFMLLKYPIVVESIYRIQFYHYQIQNMKEKEKLTKINSEIRSVASEIFKEFMQWFNFSRKTFMDNFRKEAEEVKEKCQHLDTTELFSALSITNVQP
ncbi:CLUMA_CG017348, isoform A [Clunio marinus]|uniref:CLUMA_CG017348, isoform A n=1 Tax=Clunio marinus TaxID=568069 RepID=A0A1J1IYM0_9DIPT|nr:CLUMA_CG017348, isoform A [Clunio marinus]